MKSYLDLVSQYERAHKKKNRLTLVCICISVMLVTAIFGMADMSIKAQINEYIRTNGNFHAIITGITEDIARQIGSRSGVAVSSWVGMAEDTVYQGKELIVQSSSQEFAEQMNLSVTEGRYPSAPQEALLDRQGLEQFGLSVGDTIDISFSDHQIRRYTITGTYGDFSSLKGTDAHGLFLSTEGMHAFAKDLYQEYYYIQFKNGININRELLKIQQEYGLNGDQISKNTMLLGLMGQSDDSSMLYVYITAGILFILVTMAGTFMIASSFNMSILERTQFFGLLRCLGATKKQVKRYIRLEGLRYCLKGIPIGLLAGCVVLWTAIFCLNKLNLQMIPPMPILQVSWPGIASGAGIGVLVVMLASKSPAENASRVSPQMAVTGNINHTNNWQINKASNTNLLHVDTAMGFRHAFANKKSMILITGSFAISIVLFLSFTVLITFMKYALNPLKPYAPDLSVKSAQEEVLIDPSLAEEIRSVPNIRKVYSRMFYEDIPAKDGRHSEKAMLVSYDAPQFEWAEEMLVSGSLDGVTDGSGVLIDYEQSEQLNWGVGDTLTLNISGTPREVQITGIVSDVPFDAGDGGWSIVCSESTFTALTGIDQYTIIDMQADKDVSEQVRKLLSPGMQLLDRQQRNSETRTGYYAMAVFVYGFLIVIALVALINIINTVNASVSGRISNYGMMRAIGMSGKQLKKMVMAEAAVYAASGSIAGVVLGVFLHRLFFGMLITSNWGQLWHPPLTVLIVTISAAVLTAFIAVISPTRKIEKMEIMNAVNVQ